MKIEISKSELLRVLSEGRAFAGKSRVIPILDCIHVMTRGGRIRISSSDTTDYIYSYGECRYAEDCVFCVRVKDFASYVSLVTDEVIVMDFNPDDNTLIISHSGGKTKFVTYNAGDFPSIPKMDEYTECKLPSVCLGRWLSIALSFARASCGGSVLEGVNICVDGDEVRVCGSDYNRIFIGVMPNGGLDDFNITLSPSGVGAISKALQCCEEVNIAYDRTRLSVSSDDFRIVTALMDLKYPALYSKVAAHMPEEYLEVDTDAMRMATKRIKSQFCDGVLGVTLSSAGSTMYEKYEVTASYGKRLVEEVPSKGVAFGKVDVNINVLSQALSCCLSPVVHLHHKDNERMPVFVQGVIDDYRELYILSPIV